MTSLLRAGAARTARSESSFYSAFGQGCFEGLGCIIRNKADSGEDQALPKENVMACVGVNIGTLTGRGCRYQDQNAESPIDS